MKVTPEWMNSEDLGVIIADRGMIEDHMPTRVMEVLQTYHRDVSDQTSLFFTREVVEAERRKMIYSDIRNLIQNRSHYVLPPRGRIESEGGHRHEEVGEDQIDGVLEGIEEEDEAFEEVDGPAESVEAVEEGLPGDGSVSSSPTITRKLQRDTSIDLDDQELTHFEQENGVIASDGPEQTELTVERYEGYTEISPTETTF